MKTKSLTASLLIAFCFCLFVIPTASFGQQKDETEIRRLEKLEGEAFARKDTSTLLTLFSPQLVVNTPLNLVADFDQVMNLVRAGKIDVSSDEKFIEKITFIENIAVVMGYDVVKAEGSMANAGKEVKRRYTDIWMKQNESWKLVARQATIVSMN